MESPDEADAPRTGETSVLGWREWVRLPELGVDRIKVKVDTGARSSSLHAYDVERVEREGETLLRFRVHPVQRDDSVAVEVEVPLHEERKVRPSTGRGAVRPVIVTDLEMAGRRFPVEITLANRDRMGFRMLLGREALAGRFLVDPSTSFRAGGTRRRPPERFAGTGGGGDDPPERPAGAKDAGGPRRGGSRRDPTDPPRQRPPGPVDGDEEPTVGGEDGHGGASE